MIVIHILGYFLVGFGVVGTLLPFIPYDDWWIRGADYPRPQFSVALFVGAVLISFSHWGVPWTIIDLMVLTISGLCFAFQLFRILPYTPVWAKQVVDAQITDFNSNAVFQILISNVLQTNTKYHKLIQLVEAEQPDLLLTLESNGAWEQALIDGISADYEHCIKVPLENRYGMHLFSKLPLRQQQVMYLISDEIPSIRTEVRLRNGRWVRLYCVHPTPPSPTEESASTARDAELGLLGMMIADEGNAHTVVAGDLNDVAWSRSTRLFQRISGLLDPRRGRGLFASFHADYWFARWPLDHVFHSTDFQEVRLCRMPHIGSDHYPVSMTLAHLPGESYQMEELEQDADDRTEAQRTIGIARQGKVDGLIVE